MKFADAELWGIPHRVVVAERGLEAGTLEYRHRRAADNEAIPQEGALAFLRERLGRMRLLEQGYAARDKVAEALLAATEVPVPDTVVAQQVEEHFADGHGDEDHRAEVEAETRESLKTQLILDRLDALATEQAALRALMESQSDVTK